MQRPEVRLQYINPDGSVAAEHVIEPTSNDTEEENMRKNTDQQPRKDVPFDGRKVMEEHLQGDAEWERWLQEGRKNPERTDADAPAVRDRIAKAMDALPVPELDAAAADLDAIDRDMEAIRELWNQIADPTRDLTAVTTSEYTERVPPTAEPGTGRRYAQERIEERQQQRQRASERAAREIRRVLPLKPPMESKPAAEAAAATSAAEGTEDTVH